MCIYLKPPATCTIEEIQDFKSSFINNNEHFINGSCLLHQFVDIHQWLTYIDQVSKGLVTERTASSTFFAVQKSDDRLIGVVDIRHTLPDKFLKNGHIGYAVRPEARRKGYGTQILSLAIEFAKNLSINPIIVCCSKSNVASSKVIQNNGGILKETYFDNEKEELIYHILETNK